MYFIKVNDGVADANEIINMDQLRQKFPNVSFPAIPTAEILQAFGYNFYEDVSQPALNYDEKAINNGIVLDNGIYKTSWTKVKKEGDELQAVIDGIASTIKSQRNDKLKSSDWTQAKDIPESISTPWATYRQALRDLPLQEGFPLTVVWPVEPTA